MNSDDIDLEQPSFKELAALYAEGIGRLVFWGGAGLSMPAHLPDWLGLRDSLIRVARSKATTMERVDSERLRARLAGVLLLQDIWSAFDVLYDVLERTSFSSEIRVLFQSVESCPVPQIYEDVWKLDIDGFVTLNIDGFASRGCVSSRKVKPTEFQGKRCGPWLRALKARKPFVINLHGVLDDPSSWVFRSRDVSDLQTKADYNTLISNLFGSKTVVFVGISAYDRGAGGLLEKVTRREIDLGTHFWVTSERDAATDRWAERAGIRIIRYKAQTESEHTRCLQTLLTELLKYTPRDVEARPVATPLEAKFGDLLSPPELSMRPPEFIRIQLNAAAADILGEDKPPYEKFKEFCSLYRRPIHYSWDVSVEEPDNEFFGYRLEKAIGSGAFGTVYRAIGNDGRSVAIKLLRQEVRSDESMLGSFRRGVSSMRILADHHVDGMVPYFEAFELPPCVIMDYVDGETLEAIVLGGMLADIDEQLEIAHRVALIVHKAHSLPERVLHRDLRPSNIMVRSFYATETGDYDVVVLDFDLSRHKDALEKSVTTHAATALGYLAPEQLARNSPYSTRHSAVDSFGLAMTIYFMLGGQHPTAGDSQTRDWPDRVYQRARSITKNVWKCVPERLGRLIVNSTALKQNERPDFAEVLDELELLREVCASQDGTSSAEIWAEELFNRAFPGKEYTWDAAASTLSARFASGVAILLLADDFKRTICFDVSYIFTGSETYKNVGKYLGPSVDRAAAILKRLKWREILSRKDKQTARIKFSIDLTDLIPEARKNEAALSQIGDLFSFE